MLEGELSLDEAGWLRLPVTDAGGEESERERGCVQLGGMLGRDG